ncbi:hypothetical protein NQ314_013155 [Rhamnusium bicolor]|uniref:Peroxidase n=1 Tax=Rhamnusium bicolor TaxID=1586634 RepID=A0AAV8X8H8_9CUCU|nr:hypothetical protein NQ314_013155 [Rhamnusium bicolor]
MTQPTERTRLLPEVNQTPVFDTSINRERKLRVKQFQCCLCAIFLSILLVVLIATVAYSINNSEVPSDNSTSGITNDNETILILLSNTWPILDMRYKTQTLNDNTKWEKNLEAGRKALKEKDEIEKNAPSLPVHSPSYIHQKIVATSEKAKNLTRFGYIVEHATRHMYSENVSLPEFSKLCARNQMECNIFQKYRTANGTCNNLKRPEFYGVSYRPFRRALPPDYADGISKPRVSKNGKPLPSARSVSLMVHRSYYRNDDKFSVMLAVWGQFLDHDITATALSQKSNGSTISCCDSTAVTHPECFPVQLDPIDPIEKYNVTCMEFVRSAPSPTCCLGPREQLNQVTAFIDGSVIYGADEEVTKILRNFQNGTLKMYVTKDGRTLLPISDDLNDGCNREEQKTNGKYCFLTGRKLMNKFDLSPQKRGYFGNYNDSINPNIANNFATAAFRFAHSIIPGLMKLLANDNSNPEFTQMHKMLLDPFKLYTAGELDKTLRGAMNTTLKNHLFEGTDEHVKQPKMCGLDLVSLNIQRGRDHGLPGYSFWRKHCGLKKPTKFDDLQNDMDNESLRNIKSAYRNVDDIDLYTGALSEKPIEGSILGPTLTCLILDQFVRIKHGDRFWYENSQKPQAFTPEQLDEIRKTSLASIICDNSDNLTVIQAKVMERLNSRNDYVSCLKINRPNITLWKENFSYLALTGGSINVVTAEEI